MADGRLNDEKQGGGPYQHRPARIDRDRQYEGKRRRDDRTDVGNEPQHGRKNSPQNRRRNAYQPQSLPDHYAETRVDQDLIEEKATEPHGGIVERRGGPLQIMRPGKPDQAIAEVFPLDQDEYYENDDDAGGGAAAKPMAR